MRESPNSASHGPPTDPVPSNLIGSFGLPQPLTYWLSQSDYWEQGQRVCGRPWEANFDKFLTFDSNSTSDVKSIRCAKNAIFPTKVSRKHIFCDGKQQ